MTAVGFPCIDITGHQAAFVAVRLGRLREWQEVSPEQEEAFGLQIARLNITGAFPDWQMLESWHIQPSPHPHKLNLTGFSATLAGMIAGLASKLTLRLPWRGIECLWVTGRLDRAMLLSPVDAKGFRVKLAAFAECSANSAVFIVPTGNMSDEVIRTVPTASGIEFTSLSDVTQRLHVRPNIGKLIVVVGELEAAKLLSLLFDVSLESAGKRWYRNSAISNWLPGALLFVVLIFGIAAALSNNSWTPHVVASRAADSAASDAPADSFQPVLDAHLEVHSSRDGDAATSQAAPAAAVSAVSVRRRMAVSRPRPNTSDPSIELQPYRNIWVFSRREGGRVIPCRSFILPPNVQNDAGALEAALERERLRGAGCTYDVPSAVPNQTERQR